MALAEKSLVMSKIGWSCVISHCWWKFTNSFLESDFWKFSPIYFFVGETNDCKTVATFTKVKYFGKPLQCPSSREKFLNFQQQFIFWSNSIKHGLIVIPIVKKLTFDRFIQIMMKSWVLQLEFFHLRLLGEHLVQHIHSDVEELCTIFLWNGVFQSI